MDKKEFGLFRERLIKTQKQLAQLLGTSLKAVQGYEQGWRRVPVHVERQLLFLASRTKAKKEDLKPCWAIKKCSAELRNNCPAWEFKAGDLCWFINGTICEGEVRIDWHEKMKICRLCEVFITNFS